MRKLLLSAIFGSCLLGAVWLGNKTGDAHVIPPEQLHPAADAYRKTTFILNLNPVAWDHVFALTDVIARELSKVDQARGAAYAREIAAARKVAMPTDEDADPIEGRENGRRMVFQASTRAVSDLICRHLALAEASDKRPVVTRHLQTARRVYAAFAVVIPTTDPQASQRLGLNWLEAFTQLGSPGIMGVGSKKMNHAALVAQIKPISAYLNASYQNFKAPEASWLVARPIASPTFDSSARMAIRLPPGSNINKQVPRPRQILGFASRGVDEGELMLASLGDMAFDSAFILGKKAQALGLTCNTCHNKGTVNPQFFIPGLSSQPGTFDVTNSYFAAHANDGVFNPLDIPDLRGIRFSAPYGRNGRFGSLRAFVRNVIVNEFGGPEPSPLLLDGLMAYMFEFEFLPNPYLGPGGLLKPKKVTAAAMRGQDLFNKKFKSMGDKSCGSCHVPSSYFLDHKQHDIGSLKMGFAKHSMDGAFDTPTLLNAKYTAPYFHDGSLPTLRSVVEWFDKQFKLKLTLREVGDLTAYLNTIGEGTEAYEGTPYYLDAEMEEFSFFLSTYDFLRRRKMNKLISITFRTVEAEILNHKWELRDRKYLPVMDKLAAMMHEARKLNIEGKYQEVDAIVDAYRKLYQANVDNLK